MDVPVIGMNNIILCTAILAGKLASFLLRIIGRNATSLPGRISLAIYPSLIRHSCRQARLGTIAVLGTNGKTTVSTLVARALRKVGYRVVANSAGANLTQGVATALVTAIDVSGSLHTDWLVLEVDELSALDLIPDIVPSVIVATNLYRDQLDRYGELQSLALRLSNALTAVPGDCVAVCNADDPLIVWMLQAIPAKKCWFGMKDIISPALAMDRTLCPACKELLEWQGAEYSCCSCNFKRPPMDIVGSSVKAEGFQPVAMSIFGRKIVANMCGPHNAYNLLTAASLLRVVGVADECVVSSMETATPPFGRYENIDIGERNIKLVLAKNPSGFNVFLEQLVQTQGQFNLLIAINDYSADGRDISWLWDVEFESLSQRSGFVIVSGSRCPDVFVRLQCAGVTPQVSVDDLGSAVNKFIQSLLPGSQNYILCTYTAMLVIRRELSRCARLIGWNRQ